MRIARNVVFAASSLALAGSFGCKRDGSDVAQNPDCVADLSILSADAAGANPDASLEGSTNPDGSAASTMTRASDGGSTGVVFAPCGTGDDGGSADTPDFSDDASAVPVACPSYTCVCDDSTTETGSSADPATGSCDAESQVCGIICTGHGGWM